MILEGSIKNWPSILRCCLGGVRGTGQSVLLWGCNIVMGVRDAAGKSL